MNPSPGKSRLYSSSVITISASRLQSRIEALARFGALPGAGVTRPCWSPQHEEARAWLAGGLSAAGLETWVDRAGNVFGALGLRAFGAGRRLAEAGSPIGVVDSIVGVRRTRVAFVGQADHAGTTPMERRRDGFLGAAEYALKARDLVVKHGGGKSVSNIGVVRVHPGVTNIVPARGALVLLHTLLSLAA